MSKSKQIIFLFFVTAGFLLMFSDTAKAQDISINYASRIEVFDATELPRILGLPRFNYPESARQKGVEGKLKISLTLAKNGTVQDIAVEEPLPHGITEAVINELKQLRFQPAKKNNEPIDAKMFFEFVIKAVYDEKDKNVGKPKIIEKPEPVYPENQKAKAIKGKVYVQVLFSADGSVEVLDTYSVLAKEFDEAAVEAAKKIKFQPAVHKSSSNKVSQKLTVEYNFKP
jgi:TonB family protein